MDEWVSEERVNLDSLQPPPKKEEKKLQGAAAQKADVERSRKSLGGRKRKHSEFGDSVSKGTPAPSEAGTEAVSEWV